MRPLHVAGNFLRFGQFLSEYINLAAYLSIV